MDRSYVNDRHVVARFLAGQLSEEESRSFEEYMLAHPEVVHELESTARLKVGLHRLDEAGELTALLKPKTPMGDMRYVALAASVAILALGLFFVFRNSPHQLPTLAASLGGLVSPSGVTLRTGRAYAILRTRGSTYDAQIELPASPQAIELRVSPDLTAHPARYRVTLARIADDDSLSDVGTVGGLIPDPAGFVSVYVDSSKLTHGRYRLFLRGDAGTDAVDSVSLFTLKLSPAPGS